MLSHIKALASFLGEHFGRSLRNGKESRRVFLANRARLGIEQLEGRFAPATLVWTGQGTDQNWSTANNWVFQGTQNHAVPTMNDDVIFTGTYLKGSIVDPAFHDENSQQGINEVKSVTIESTYTQQITLQENLTVKTTDQYGGTIFGGYSYIVPATGTYNWSGGKLRGFNPASSLVVVQTGASLDIKTAGIHTLDGRTIQVYGTLNWLGDVGGTYALQAINGGGIVVNSGGEFNVPALGGTYNFGGDAYSWLTNNGRIVIGNGPQVNLGIGLVNSGEVNLGGALTELNLFSGANFQDGSQITGIGRVDNFGVMQFTDGITTVTGGAFLGGENGSTFTTLMGALHVTNGSSLDIVGATTLSGVSAVEIENGGLLVIDANLTINGITINNDGVTTWNAGYILIFGGSFNNDAPDKSPISENGHGKNQGFRERNRPSCDFCRARQQYRHLRY